MLIFRGLHSTDKTPVALTIGNFDGVHLGHQALLKQLRMAAQLLGLPTAVLVFEPHPREFFTPQEAPVRLTSMREKLEFFATLDVDRVYVCRFNSSFAQMSAVDFIHALHEKLAAKFVLIGDDFRFGNRRSGDIALMEKIGSQQGFKVEVMHRVSHNGVRISSTAVRAALVEGDLRAAQRYLGRPYGISGRVVHGDGLGKQLGFPTANIQLKHNRPPLTGIFVVRVQGDGLPPMQGVASLGVRPTVKQNGKPVLEVHLFDFSGEIYNKHLRVDFLHKLRDEVKYLDLQSLTQQIELDVCNAKQWFIQHD
ncbi:bifunctional riboflavin kinase/FAD synthetase [Candidatus Nitrotoga sp. 1052]|uniref:bifunctional riboflavin kinase/FAD synthetase n=1 Tax=Candidatus Nitrotoga sp. 1052 TaxID=2886964 RepID=UPI001EF6B5A6|nr:bifunctional riboflavin kinase/FAD synthetase [Candidatus Nitrotoga sp. 1052]CAH1085537.1 bifunctional riboflavin kinase/FMN adenylyltransferase [Candidatus Nitrotoga sp. 1052]